MKFPKAQSPGVVAAGHNRNTLATVRVAALSELDGQPWRYSDRDIDIAAQAAKHFPDGAPLPIIANAKLEVLVGGIFAKALQQAGVEYVTIIRAEGLTALEQKHYSVAIQKLLGKGVWEPANLESWLREFEVGIEDFSHVLIGFDNGELDAVLGIPKKIIGGAAADDVPPLMTKSVSQLGTVWQAGAHRVLVGDATRAEDMQRLMAAQVGKLVITDPPFGCPIEGFASPSKLHPNFVQGAGDMTAEELEAFFFSIASNLGAVLRKGALIYIFIDWRSLHILLGACERVFGPLLQFCCWVKNRPGMGSFYRSQHELVPVFRMPGGKHKNNVMLGTKGRNRSNVWDYPAATSSRSGREGDMLKHHPTPKTVEMIADAILDSTEPGDRLIDCFLGSGTTLIAAERTGRICHGMDLDPRYVDVAIRRWQDWTGEDAIDADSGRTFNEIARGRDTDDDQAMDAALDRPTSACSGADRENRKGYNRD